MLYFCKVGAGRWQMWKGQDGENNVSCCRQGVLTTAPASLILPELASFWLTKLKHNNVAACIHIVDESIWGMVRARYVPLE